ncbi:hypothetical protein RFI_04715, partial [Reticulomyxa filosa]
LQNILKNCRKKRETGSFVCKNKVIFWIMATLSFTHFVQTIANEVGIHSLSSDLVDYIEQDVRITARQLVSDSKKFAYHCLRGSKLLGCDINNALEMRNSPPMVGCHEATFMPTQERASGGSKKSEGGANGEDEQKSASAKSGKKGKILMKRDKRVTLSSLKKQVPLKPADISISIRWLMIDGVIPKSYVNAPERKDIRQMKDSIKAKKMKRDTISMHRGELYSNDIRLKKIIAHRISKEQQMLYEVLCNAMYQCDRSTL